MKTLVGTWQIADRPTSALRIRFYLTAGETVLVEAWERAGVPYSMTLYHRDGAALIATHYCPQGNQPRLALLRSRRNGEVAFAFRDATDLDPAREAYLTRLWFDLSDPGHPIRRESYREKGKDAASELMLARATAGVTGEAEGGDVDRQTVRLQRPKSGHPHHYRTCQFPPLVHRRTQEQRVDGLSAQVWKRSQADEICGMTLTARIGACLSLPSVRSYRHLVPGEGE